MSGPSAAGSSTSLPIQPQWQVKTPPPPPQTDPQTQTGQPAPRVYGPTLEDQSRVGNYARDGFDQHRFPDADGSQFEERPLGDRIKDKAQEFAEDHPVVAGTIVAGALAAVGEGKIDLDRNVNLMGLNGKLGVSAEYDPSQHRRDPLSGNRYNAGPEFRGGVSLSFPLGGRRDE